MRKLFLMLFLLSPFVEISVYAGKEKPKSAPKPSQEKPNSKKPKDNRPSDYSLHYPNGAFNPGGKLKS